MSVRGNAPVVEIEGSGFRVQEWGFVAFPNPEPRTPIGSRS